MRQDDPAGVMKFKDAYRGGTALLVLGGLSAAYWQEVRDKVNPDVILGANGTSFAIRDLDFHLIVENMKRSKKRADAGDPRAQEMLRIFTSSVQAKVRLISFLSWELVANRENAVCIKRMGELGDDYESQFRNFSFREYGEGYLAGPLFAHPGALTKSTIKFRVGTVGTQLIHHAGILGVSQVHTIGFDLCFKDISRHHWYKYPNYQPDTFRTQAMFTSYQDLDTQWDWVQGAKWLKGLTPLFERDQLEWVDHSDGLLSRIK